MSLCMSVQRSKETRSISVIAQVTGSDMSCLTTVASKDVTTSLLKHLITLATSLSLGIRL